MRVLLVLASTLVAGYIAWVSWNKQGAPSVFGSDEGVAATTARSKQDSQKDLPSIQGRLQLAFDMVSGRYLYNQWTLHRKSRGQAEGKVE
ncbi:hypothetical protein KFL_005130140 [Klebsormidium nitens]|uniref:Uncharacterized protein n=1 Tax=Klebsormidium nitens TaxID=105231 RepID=A0A1Y1IEI3_KLENI|nr:hypothetical protein KFL_005130140 [Klebsormidium nitens]|eukprot:GAQ89354.1 hypothetical protein KFL_005130140 [Klebsormidium nitens]